MFKLARKNYLREIFSGGGGCTGDCGQGRRCTCSSKSEEMSQAPYEHKTLRLVSIDQTSGLGPEMHLQSRSGRIRRKAY